MVHLIEQAEGFAISTGGGSRYASLRRRWWDFETDGIGKKPMKQCQKISSIKA
jgi:hypothetical protein